MTTENVEKVADELDELIVKQKLLDAQDREVGQQIVKDANPKTIEAARQLAANWIATAAQESRNLEYMTGERDKLLKLTEAVTSELPDSTMTQDQIDFREKVKNNVFAQLGSPDVLRVRLKEVRDHWKLAEDRAGDFEARLEMEKRSHDETRGYRQHTEKLLEDLHAELRATIGSILLDLDDAMSNVDPAVSDGWTSARTKLVKLKDFA